MELIDINLQDRVVMQHNAITSGRYDFTACQLDLLFMILAQLEVGKTEYIIHTSDIEAITGRQWQINQLTKSTELILTKMFEVEDSESYTQFVLFQYFKYLKGQRSIQVKLSDIALPYFFELKSNFTALQLRSTLSVTSKYAKRLYALGCQWRSVGKKRFEIEELKKMLGLIDKKGKEQFEEISAFRKNVLDIAKKQINEESDIYFDYKLIKQGRSFRWVEIYVNAKMAQQLIINFEESIDNQKYVSKLVTYGFSQVQAELIAEKEKEKDFDILITELNEKIRQRKLKIENAVGYLIGVYQKKGILSVKN
ncbi:MULTISPECIES: replication initiation protein [unclassified Chryseobacterium]|uniref:replication initiation protein n=1 Tax=unclassified Chryseobacterium TaxID=2593645 RepID=UPI000D3D73E4|nr:MULTISPECIES: replication initiation protein [unclassified Chryseobacterium]PTT75520.1 RepB family plasmid replication initiator protein [Chryseobacterium sp. HMWF001]PVV57495.1 replication initiation protein [Chryseobacterium sp. HMWF035]